jgi:hypothetical protein
MKTRVRATAGAALLALLLALAGTLPVAAAPARSTSVAPATNHFAAIAVEPATTAYGVSYGYTSKSGAKTRARNECRSAASHPGNCEVMVWVRNGCASIAYKARSGGGYTYGWGIGSNKNLAKQRARQAIAPGGHTLAWACSG